MLVEALQSYLSADTGAQTQLGTPSTRADQGTGIFPTQASDEVPLPFLVYQQISGQPLQTSMQGTGRLQTARWRFTCYGETYKQAKTLARAVRLALIGFDGPQAGNAEVHGSWLRLELDGAQPIPKGTVYATHLDFEIIFRDGD
jgi:hypothetical protein